MFGTASVLLGLARGTVTAAATVPFTRPWRGPDRVVSNIAISATREVVRALLGYTSSLPNADLRSLEGMIDAAARLVTPATVSMRGVGSTDGSLGGVKGTWYRPRNRPTAGTILYFHGGGYVATTPSMYSGFAALLADRTGCEVFVADYRLAPEFPFPAAINDALAVLTGAFEIGIPASQVIVAGDSAGGGLATALMCATEMEALPTVAGLVLLSPHVDLHLDKPSITENAAVDILPPDIPTDAYLQGVDPGLRCVSVIEHEVGPWPPTLVSYGTNEMFRDSIRLLVRRLDESGVDTVALEEPGMFHVFPILVPWSAPGRRALDAITAFVAESLG